MSEFAVDINDVSKRFGEVRSLQGLTLQIEHGAVFGFLGPNGAGKTTTLRVLLGLVRPDAGRASVLGLDCLAEARSVRRQVGVLLEADGLYERLSAVDNLTLFCRIHHLPRAEWDGRIESLLRSFDLWMRRQEMVATWSRGMRQKLAVARALLHKPRVLLLDEPFAGLDPVAAVDLRSRIVALARQAGVTVVITTHDLGHVEKACSHVAVIQAGRIIASGTPDALAAPAKHLEVEVTGQGLRDEILGAMRAEKIVIAYTLNGRSARITCTREAGERLATELVQRGVVLQELRTVQGSLEEAFLSLMSGDPEKGRS